MSISMPPPPPLLPASPPPPSTITSIATIHAITTATKTVSQISPSTVSKPSTSIQLFSFTSLKNTTSCSALELSWSYSGQAAVAMTLIVQDQMVPSAPMLITGSSTGNLPTTSVSFRTLTTDVPSNADNYIWPSVDVNEGWYTAKAFDTAASLGISAVSEPFFVSRGTNTSCFSPDPTNATAATSSVPANATSTFPSPRRGALHSGDIIGISLGVTVGIIFLFAAFIFPRMCRRELPSPKGRRPYLLY
ncbi:hypothetical protein GALMADRAFT_134924 [Galerina marginata CBS 339.88]|uniref:Mid2 domain-containing protein n=1 Tax=Galerina marginata (strain CBS 339.88) TaxID=685588 RepID=A0A067TGP1_GALM3|nr:hypothetical protein GALMADRAFT_134924 [Galerina marginata CBS 339.88]